jgi:predicted DNA-binding transcriptional regulator AlpA
MTKTPENPGIKPQYDELINPHAAARLLSVSVQLMAKMRFDGKGPAYFKIGRAVRYRRRDLEQWLFEIRVDPVAVAAAA